MFKAGDRITCIDCPSLNGTIKNDDGYSVVVDWDDGKRGDLIYSHSVAYNAYRLIKIANAKQ